jgi:hypothetical protein
VLMPAADRDSGAVAVLTSATERCMDPLLKADNAGEQG